MQFFFRKNKKTAAPLAASTKPKLDYRAVAATDVGSVRTNNEDHLVFFRPFDANIRNTHGCLALVADGMGGHSSGEVASKMAAEIIARNYYDHKGNILDSLKEAFIKANKAIFQHASRRPSRKGMGTTCTAVVLIDRQIYLGHVGDSRAYLLKNRQLIQLSKDHTYIQHLFDTGKITKEEMLSHPERNVITKAMGTSAKLQADYLQHKFLFEDNDKLVICSDGLYEYVNKQELAHIVSTQSLNDATKKLIHLAKQRGGHDNISVLIVESFQSSINQSERATQKINLS